MNSASFFSCQEISQTYPANSWQNIVFSEFANQLESNTRPFPCIFGVQGFRDDQLRYVFQDRFDVDGAARALGEFVRQSRSFGPNTSLVLFLKPDEVSRLEDYQTRFWDILRALADRDEQSWPKDVPTDLTDPLWEFCFAGEPIFVVCNTPAHVLRQSRRSSGLMLTFQPRWVFDKILGTERAAVKAFASVRKRLERYDLVPTSPALGKYGEEGVLEYRQYFLDERNGDAACPFHALKSTDENKTLLEITAP